MTAKMFTDTVYPHVATVFGLLVIASIAGLVVAHKLPRSNEAPSSRSRRRR